MSAVMLFILMFFGCAGSDGADGQDGQVYIAIGWVGNISFVFSDPHIPYTIINEQYYLTTPGYYTFAYEAWDGSQWSGNYTLNIEEGEPGESGSFMQDGADGQDICVTLGCWNTGPEIYNWYCNSAAKVMDENDEYEKEQEEFMNSEIPNNHSNESIQLSNHLLNFELNNDDPSVIIQEGTKGKFSYRLIYKQIK